MISLYYYSSHPLGFIGLSHIVVPSYPSYNNIIIIISIVYYTSINKILFCIIIIPSRTFCICTISNISCMSVE